MINIKIVILGHFPHSTAIKKIKKWKSSLFKITDISAISIISDSDGMYWEYSDDNMDKQIPQRGEEDILVAITNVPIQNNYYARRFSNNRVCISYHEIAQILEYHNIPKENLVLRILYSFALVYKYYGNSIPTMSKVSNLSHDETRGCLFDMNGFKTDIIYSTHKPQVCEVCIHKHTNNPIASNRIERNLIDSVQKELKKINKGLYYQMIDITKKYPIYSLFISFLTAIVIGIFSSYIYDKIKESYLSTSTNEAKQKDSSNNSINQKSR
ncbi:MAG: hypothetical protein U0264_17190 [Candidatus Kapaibacterium sp.]